MLKRYEKFRLLCYNRYRLPYRMPILPGMLGQCVYVYMGRKFERLIISSMFMLFFTVTDFIVNKRIGSVIHAKSKRKKK